MIRTLVLLALLGCRGGARTAGDAAPAPEPPDATPVPEVVAIERIVMEEGAWPTEAGAFPDARELADGLRSDLVGSGLFILEEPPGERRVRRAQLHAAFAVEVGSGRSRAKVVLTLRWLEESDDFDVHLESDCDGKAGENARALLACALSRGASGLVARETIRRGDRKAVLAALRGNEADLREAAFAAVAEHAMRETVPELLRLLAGQDIAARDGAIGALVALREPSAVGPLTRLAEFKDLNMMRRVIDAIGSIGGDEAEAYLELVAAGHEDPTIQKMAEQALKRAIRRRADPPP